MSKICKSSLANPCGHKDITIGPRGANCLKCRCFLYSQADNYKEKSNLVATINQPDESATPDIVPFEYYDGLMREEMDSKDEVISLTPQLFAIRKKLIDYIIELGDRFKQRNLTIHTAAVYLDRALQKFPNMLLSRLSDPDNENISSDHCNLWAIVSLMLASKYDEIDRRIPFYKEIINASTRAAVYTRKEFHIVEEFFVLRVLDWDFRVLTTLHFTHCLISQGILFEDDSVSQPQDKILKSLTRKAELFTDLSLDSEKLNSEYHKKSKIAVSCIVAARKICGIKPLWNNKLYNMTSYHFFDIKDILDVLIREYCVFFNEEYSKIMQNTEPRKPKMQQRPMSFIGRRASEKPKLHGQLTHIQSTKSLKINDVMSSKPTRNTFYNLDLKSVKLDACEGDTFSSSLSIPDENETDAGTPKENTKIDEKCTTRSGTQDSEDLEPKKIYIMKFKSMNETKGKF